MNKARVEAFTDAIVAIVMTIMVLEIKIPSGSHFSALWSEKAYFLAYLISFFRIAATWYNHHFLFTSAQWISRKVFWANVVWLFFMSLFPVATGWISADPFSKAAAYFYFLIFAIWGITFYIMVAMLANDNPQRSPQIMLMLRPQRWLFELLSLVTGLVLIAWLPIASLLIVAINIIFWIVFPPKGSDQITGSRDNDEK
ncbi:TMEM175 family protein [uncultured Limosilactobacillus sp.]|uniref:TMEM175 family protein n=1 Tax=uncultured Limosilactobacillus sp. TaxID=2837629 RepID=UPI0025FF1BBA|nr:TMEM175 family protein [uncultured Limosilactobacillus sp.]